MYLEKNLPGLKSSGIPYGIYLYSHAENAEEDKTFTVNVIDPSLPTLKVTPSEVNLGLNSETTVTVTFEGKDITKEADYKSDEESIATAEKGVVKSKDTEGTAKIAVSLTGANSGFLTVNVTDYSEEVELNNDVLRDNLVMKKLKIQKIIKAATTIIMIFIKTAIL